jgi:hypothetical protein
MTLPELDSTASEGEMTLLTSCLVDITIEINNIITITIDCSEGKRRN